VDFTHLITLTPTLSEWSRYDFLREGDSTRVPGLHIDSWYTFQAYGTTKAFEYLSGNSPNQHLVMGPTSHCMMGSETEHTVVGERDVGDARFDRVTDASYIAAPRHQKRHFLQRMYREAYIPADSTDSPLPEATISV
jgi:predicted acyl esterase